MDSMAPLGVAQFLGTTPVPFAAIPEEIAPGVPLDLLVPASAHPSNQLLIERRVKGRALTPVRATSHGIDGATGIQYFRALVPALAPGEVMELIPTLSRAGQVLERMLPKTIRAAAPATPAASAVNPRHDTAIPRYEYGMEFLGALNVQLAKPAESFGATADGLHITFWIASGEIRGPKINATILGEGGDWMNVRRDGVGEADVRITFKTDDGALLLSCYYGIFDLGPDGYARALREDYDPVPPLVVVPRFVTSHPDWLWLSRLQCVGIGRVTMADLKVRFDLYAVHVGQPLPSSGLPRVAGVPPV
jgi:Protein of unknown function (DUF3237)